MRKVLKTTQEMKGVQDHKSARYKVHLEKNIDGTYEFYIVMISNFFR